MRRRCTRSRTRSTRTSPPARSTTPRSSRASSPWATRCRRCPTGGPYTNAAVADLYVLPNWCQFAGGDQLRGARRVRWHGDDADPRGDVAAADPFTYQNSQDLTIATTSQQYRSGTFDFDLPGGTPITVDITPVNLSNLSKYAPVSWSCKAGGADYPFTATPIAGSEWSKITLTVAPNLAISCIQTVRLEVKHPTCEPDAPHRRGDRRPGHGDGHVHDLRHPRHADGRATARLRRLGAARQPHPDAEDDRAEAVRGALRIAMADPKALYDTCSASGLHNEVVLANPGLDVGVHTVCTTVNSAAELDDTDLRVGVDDHAGRVGRTARRDRHGVAALGQRKPARLAERHHHRQHRRQDLVAQPARARAEPPRQRRLHDARVGRDRAECSSRVRTTPRSPISDNVPTFFASGIYYFESDVTFSGRGQRGDR